MATSRTSTSGLAVNDTVVFRFDNNGEITSKPHVFIGLVFTDEGVVATPSAGTITSIKVETINNPGVWQAITNGSSISATSALSTLSVAAHVTAIQIITTGITDADGISVNVSASDA